MLSGYGDSDKPSLVSEYSMQTVVAEIKQLLDALTEPYNNNDDDEEESNKKKRRRRKRVQVRVANLSGRQHAKFIYTSLVQPHLKSCEQELFF